MPSLSTADQIAKLKQAKAAAQAVRSEVKRQNVADPLPDAIEVRRPVLQRAMNQIRLIDDEITDLTAAATIMTLNATMVEHLDALAVKLDKATRANALFDLGLKTLSNVLNAVSEVREIIG